MSSATKSPTIPLARRMAALGVGVLAVAGLSVGAASTAQAGGGNQVYVFGATKATCATNLKNSVEAQRVFGHTVTGIHGCRRTGDGKRWFGDYVVN